MVVGGHIPQVPAVSQYKLFERLCGFQNSSCNYGMECTITTCSCGVCTTLYITVCPARMGKELIKIALLCFDAVKVQFNCTPPWLRSQQLDKGPSIRSSQSWCCVCELVYMVSGSYIEKGFLAKCPRPSSVIALKWGGSYSSGVSSWYVSFINKYLYGVCISFLSHKINFAMAEKQEDTVLASTEAKLQEAAVKAAHTSAGILSNVLQICTSILIKRHTWYLTELTLAFCRAKYTVVIYMQASANCGVAPFLQTQSKHRAGNFLAYCDAECRIEAGQCLSPQTGSQMQY